MVFLIRRSCIYLRLKIFQTIRSIHLEMNMRERNPLMHPKPLTPHQVLR